ncbi:MAG TPA: response regulator [Gemmatimonadales bacterium]|jgi:DNA-binding response OmpR family regulator|nr:response regulator [Gemmatimonadales bacterium]
MNILLAEDDAVAGRALRAILEAQGHGVDVAENGLEAWGLWQLTGHRIVVSDWLMPEMDGLELCRKIRRRTPPPYTYFVLQTIRSGLASFLEAMEAGVDDFITKPVAPEELVARLRVAERILGVREELLTLEGLLAICTYCKRLRDDHDTWIPLEQYVAAHSTAQFSHGVCPDCYEKYLRPQLESS